MSRLIEKYKTTIVPNLKTKLGKTNPNSLPKLQKIVLNMGVGKALQDKNRMEQAAADLSMISGQKPQITLARKSIATFKVREGYPVGCKVTLRRQRMWEFLDRLISVAVPRIRDFRGLNGRSFDGRGNYSMGIQEQIILSSAVDLLTSSVIQPVRFILISVLQ